MTQKKKPSYSELLALEPRIVFDAAGAVTAVEATDNTDAISESDIAVNDDNIDIEQNPNIDSSVEILFIDPRVQDSRDLANGLRDDIHVIWLNPAQDGLAQIGEALSSFEKIDSIHIITHAEENSLILGSNIITSNNIDDLSDGFANWGDYLSEDADILFYGCDLAKTSDGQMLLDTISDITGADIAASEDLTGYEKLGGDWVLEYNSGDIEANIAVNEETRLGYSHVLIVPPSAPFGADGDVIFDEDVPYFFSPSDFGFNDADGDSFANVRIDVLPVAGDGLLTFNGTAVTTGQIIPVANIANLIFTPDPNESGFPYNELRFTVQDSSGDFSDFSNTLFFAVDPVPDAPEGVDKTITAPEDGSYSFSVADFGFSDGDGDSFKGIKIIDVPLAGNGTLKLSGIDVAADQIILASEIPNLVFTPDADENDTNYNSFTFAVIDNTDDVDTTPNTITIDVSNTPDAPFATNQILSINEDTAHVFSSGDFGFNDVDGDSFTNVRIDVLPSTSAGSLTFNDVAVIIGQVIPVSSLANLKYTPSENSTDATSFMFTIQDSSSQFSASANLLSIYIRPVEDPPTGEDKTITLTEDSSYTFQLTDFAFNDGDGDSINAIIVTERPPSDDGYLTIGNSRVGTGQYISLSQFTSLTFIPSFNGSGENYSSFKFKVVDSKGYPAEIENTITFNVTPTPDLPSARGSYVEFDEDQTYRFSESDFGFFDPDGDTVTEFIFEELIDPNSGVLTFNDVPVTMGQVIPVSDISGLLFTPSPDYNAIDISLFSFKVKSDAGELSNLLHMGADIYPVNDNPFGTDNVITIKEDGSYSFKAEDFGFMDADVNNGKESYTFGEYMFRGAASLAATSMYLDECSGYDHYERFDVFGGDRFTNVIFDTIPNANNGMLQLNGVDVTIGQSVAVEDIPDLIFTPVANENGLNYNSFTFSVQDSAGLLDTIPNTITFDVTPEPDAPTGEDSSIIIDEDGSHAFSKSDFGFNDADDPDSFENVRIDEVPNPANGILTFNNIRVTEGQLIPIAEINNLVFTPAKGVTGSDYNSFTFSVQDDTGSFAETPNNLRIDVFPVSDAPIINVIDASGDAGDRIPLSISIELVDTDGSEVLLETVTLDNIPDDVLLFGKDGRSIEIKKGSASILLSDLDDLSIETLESFAGLFTLQVRASSQDGMSEPAGTVQKLNIEIIANDDVVTLPPAEEVPENGENGPDTSPTAPNGGNNPPPSNEPNFNGGFNNFNNVNFFDTNNNFQNNRVNLYLTGTVDDQIIIVNKEMVINIKKDIFRHSDPTEKLTYEAVSAEGGDLPDWLSFDPEKLTFSGTPPIDAPEDVDITIIAKDSDGNEVRSTFRIIINQAEEGVDESIPDEKEGLLNILQGDYTDHAELGLDDLEGRNSFAEQLFQQGQGGQIIADQSLIDSLNQIGKTLNT